LGNYLYGFDLSMDCSGVTIFDLHNKQPVYVGSIKTNPKQTHGKRLKFIEDEVIKLTEQYPPEIIIIERGFSRFNTSTQVIYRTHGVINKYFHNIEQIYYPPKTIKETIIHGNATKKFVKDVIQIAYPNIEFKNEDESDSFAVALTYLIKNKYINWDKNHYKQILKTKNKK